MIWVVKPKRVNPNKNPELIGVVISLLTFFRIIDRQIFLFLNWIIRGKKKVVCIAFFECTNNKRPIQNVYGSVFFKIIQD